MQAQWATPKQIKRAFLIQMEDSTCLYARYDNAPFLDYLEDQHRLQDLPLPKTWEEYEGWGDTLGLEGFVFDYPTIKQYLQRSHQTPLGKQRYRTPHSIVLPPYKISRPLFAENHKTAISFVTYTCGHLCYSASLYIYKKGKNGWFLAKRKVLRIG